MLTHHQPRSHCRRTSCHLDGLAPSLRRLVVLVDLQNLLVGAARAGCGLDLGGLARVLSGLHPLVQVHAFTVEGMVPPRPATTPSGTTVHLHVQPGGKNVDIMLAVHALTHSRAWFEDGAAVALASGDADFIPLLAALVALGGADRVGLVLPEGRSCSRALRHGPWPSVELPWSDLGPEQAWRAA